MATDIKFVFVATGKESNFTAYGARHVAWFVKRLNRMKGKASSPLTPPALVRFVQFDFENNRIVVYEHSFPAKGKKSVTSRAVDKAWKDFASFSSEEGTAAEDPSKFVTKSSLVSIIDVYRAVRNAPRGSVLDVTVYSHGFLDGPVLANTNDPEDKGPHGEPIRSDADRDGRRRSDFTAHMGERDVDHNLDALEKFRAGFAPKATFRICGCDIQDVVDGRKFGEDKRSLLRSTTFEVIHAAYTKQMKSGTAAGKLLRKKKKPATLEIDMEPDFANEDKLNDDSEHLTDFTKDQLRELHYGLDTAFFPDPLTGGYKFTTSFAEVIKFVARQTQIVYVFVAAKGLPDVACIGAVPGSAGGYQKVDPKLMFVPRSLWAATLHFFSNFMGVDFDERDYGVFDSTGVAAIDDHATNG